MAFGSLTSSAISCDGLIKRMKSENMSRDIFAYLSTVCCFFYSLPTAQLSIPITTDLPPVSLGKNSIKIYGYSLTSSLVELTSVPHPKQ